MLLVLLKYFRFTINKSACRYYQKGKRVKYRIEIKRGSTLSLSDYKLNLNQQNIFLNMKLDLTLLFCSFILALTIEVQLFVSGLWCVVLDFLFSSLALKTTPWTTLPFIINRLRYEFHCNLSQHTFFKLSFIN